DAAAAALCDLVLAGGEPAVRGGAEAAGAAVGRRAGGIVRRRRDRALAGCAGLAAGAARGAGGRAARAAGAAEPDGGWVRAAGGGRCGACVVRWRAVVAGVVMVGLAGSSAAAAAELPRGGSQIFPRYRVVAYYGAAGTPALGVLGQGSPD